VKASNRGKNTKSGKESIGSEVKLIYPKKRKGEKAKIFLKKFCKEGKSMEEDVRSPRGPGCLRDRE